MSFSRSFLATAGFVTFAAAPGTNSCHQDNCYRAFNGDVVTPAAASFCSTFTTATILTNTGIPTYATQFCQATDISSVCACAYPATATPTVTTASASATSCATIGSCFSSISSSISASLSSSVSSRILSSVSSSISSVVPSTSAPSPVIYGPGCNADNCLRAFDRGQGQSFCYSYTAGLPTSTPIYTTMCSRGNLASEISSACTCLNYYNTPTSPATTSPSTTSSSTTSSPTTTPLITTLQTSSTTSVASPVLYGPGCNADNCLRAFDHFQGQSFCSSYTTGLPTTPPMYTTACSRGNIASEISSTCTCLNYYNTATTTALITTSPTSFSTSTSTTPAPSHFNADNCLRAMIREGGAGVTPFCSQFLNAVVTATTALPTYATMCANAVSQVSSACTCLPFATG